MASVADNETQVVVAGEAYTCLDVADALGRDVQHGVVTERASVRRVGGRAASVVGEVSPETSGRVVDLVLLIGEVGRNLGALGRVVRIDVAERALERVVAGGCGRGVDAQVAANGRVQQLPLPVAWPAVVAGGTLALVAVAIPCLGHPGSEPVEE